jgi:hypothetical protein
VKEPGSPTRGAGSFFGGSDGFAACADTVSVKVQKRISGDWRAIKSTTTSSTGGYQTHLRNRHGRYRSVAPVVTKGMDTWAPFGGRSLTFAAIDSPGSEASDQEPVSAG